MKKIVGFMLVFLLVIVLAGCTVDGEIGLQGEQGEQGPMGEPGPQGEPGLDGTNGLDGQDGMDGNNGLSAYELWIAMDGNEDKTIEEFFDSLVGEIDASEVEMLQEQIDELKLMNDVLQLKLWLETVQEVFTSGDMYPYMDIPMLSYGSVVTGGEHTFDYSSMNNTVTLTLTLDEGTYDVVEEYEIIMNQAEIDAMNQAYVDAGALELQIWLDGLTNDFMTGDTLPQYPILSTPGAVSGAYGLVFNHITQNGNVVLTVTLGGQTATASRTFTIMPNYQLMVQQDQQFLNSWLYGLADNFDSFDNLPTPPSLPNGSTIVSGFPHDFGDDGDIVTLIILNGSASAQVSREFDVSPF